MGQKTNPRALRIGISDDSDSVWFDDREYGAKILEDFSIRNFLQKEFKVAAVSKICIFRKADQIEVNVHSARAGVIFAKNSIDIDVITEQLNHRIKNKVVINIIENKKPDLTATLLAEWISAQIVKRVPFRRAMKMAMQKALKAGAKGIKVSCSGRLGGIEIARTEWYKEGKVPLHTLRAIVDYSFCEADTTYGKIGVKVWVYKGQDVQQSMHLNPRDKNENLEVSFNAKS